MTASPLWRKFESGDDLFFRVLRVLILFGGVFLLGFTGILELTWPQQIVLGIITIALVVWLDRSSSSYLITLTLMLVSIFSTFRYGYWRISTTVRFFHDPGSVGSGLDAFFISLLLLAELYAFTILFLGYLQTLWPLRRTPVPLPDDTEQWPAIDLLIPTYNEPLSVVKYTALAAMNIDWPSEKLNVYLLDDGRREEFRRFAEEAGIGYMTRDDNVHAKAGNINHALEHLDAPFVAIFDCDHIPTRSFMQVTMGWFLRDSKLAMLQTPHHFYSPDPFERNLDQFRTIPNEGELFYGIVQDGNDFWNATFFCGSCAVLRRSALDQIGGIAVETVTEDAHTSLRMQMNGWNTAYINIPQAAGLATERLSGHVKQRIRWARGMIQIMRTDNPLFARGLTAAQRLCYFNAMSHFLYALPRLIFLTAPLIYLIFGHVNIPGYWAAILAYAFPHLVLSNITNSRIQGQHRHSFWNEIYETVLAPYIFLPTMLAMISPKLGNFDVTAKGGVVNRKFFDSRIAQPFLLLILMNVVGLLCAIPRFIQFPVFDLRWPPNMHLNLPLNLHLNLHLNLPMNLLAGMYDGNHTGTIVMNLLWLCFNMIILGVATAVAWESQQRRQTVRVPMSVPADVLLPNGAVLQGVTTDMSSGGLMVRIEREFTATIGASVKLTLPVLDGNATLPATLVGIDGNVLRVQFDPLNLQEEEALTMVLYSRADTWLGWGESREPDHPLRSLARIFRISLRGFAQTIRALTKRKPARPKVRLATSVVPMVLLAVLFAACTLRAQDVPKPDDTKADAPKAEPKQEKPPATQPVQNTNAPAPTPPAAGSPTPPASGEAPAPPASGQPPVPHHKILPTAALAPTPPPVVVLGNFDNVVSLSDIGVRDNIVLRGTDAYNTVHFSLPQTETVKTATMKLRYHVSPGLLPSLSQLKVSLNGTLFATLAVEQPPAAPAATGTDNKSEHSAPLEATLTLPAAMLVHDNALTFEFVGHYALKCEDPAYSALWSQVDSDSTIELAGSLTALHDDLKMLPLPFYDAGVNLRPVIPIVFLTQPSSKALQAAGIVASWFGILADPRPVRFSVSIGTIPPGNAIIIGDSAGSLPASLKLTASTGPSIAMRANPSDPNSKVLVLTGDTADDLLTAAMGLTLQRDLLQGEQVHIPSLNMPAARQPDDAPRWLSTEKINRIGDSGSSDDLQNDGSAPIAVSMRLPPDLYYGPRQKLGFHLGYRYNAIPLSSDSTLQVFLNSAYISSTPLPHNDEASAQLETVVPVPISDLRPFSNSLLMRFLFQPAKKGGCQDTPPNNLQGAILRDSYLDIHDIPHWAVLPNLEIFANAGYPFTRKADLADTAVVLPDNATPEELELFLELMGHFGGQTGYPVLNVTVTDAEGMNPDSQKDYLVLGTVDDQPALNRLNPSLPVMVDGSGLHIQDTQGFFDQLQHAWWKVRSSDRVQSGQLEIAGGLPDALIEGIEWPSRSNHSVVVITLRDRSVVANLLSVFLATSQTSDISQSVSVLHGSRFVSYRIGKDFYHVGFLSRWVQLNMLFSDYPWLMVVSTIVFCFLLAVILRTMLRRRARARLHGN